jgi:hypothetical protein
MQHKVASEGENALCGAAGTTFIALSWLVRDVLYPEAVPSAPRRGAMTTKALNRGNEALLDRENADRARRVALHSTLQQTAPIRFGRRYSRREKGILSVAWTGMVLMLASLLGFVYAASQSYMFH